MRSHLKYLALWARYFYIGKIIILNCIPIYIYFTTPYCYIRTYTEKNNAQWNHLRYVKSAAHTIWPRPEVTLAVQEAHYWLRKKPDMPTIKDAKGRNIVNPHIDGEEYKGNIPSYLSKNTKKSIQLMMWYWWQKEWVANISLGLWIILKSLLALCTLWVLAQKLVEIILFGFLGKDSCLQPYTSWSVGKLKRRA